MLYILLNVVCDLKFFFDFICINFWFYFFIILCLLYIRYMYIDYVYCINFLWIKYMYIYVFVNKVVGNRELNYKYW